MSDHGCSERHTLVFQPSGARGEVAGGTSIRRAAADLGVEIASICADKGTCGKCRVVIEDGRVGSVDSTPDHCSPMRSDEQEWLARRTTTWEKMGLDPDRLRLSCQAEVRGDLVVFVPESSRGNRQVIRKGATDRPIQIRPSVRRYYLRVEPASLGTPRGDAERLLDALAAAMGRMWAGSDRPVPRPGDFNLGLDVVRRLGHALRAEDGRVSVTVWQDRRVVDVRPGLHERLYGIAIDIGSTALAAMLCDLVTGEVVETDSMMNPQTEYGDDIMSRMKFEVDRDDGLATLNDAVVAGLDRLIARLLRAGSIEPADVFEVAVVGNTTMHHLFLGISTRGLSSVPFVPAVTGSLDVAAGDLGLASIPSANVHMLPIAASFVGADAVGVTIAEEPHHQDDQVLIVDVGTNAELIAGNRHGLVCTSTPTGPAFEGAHVEYGMRAADGALERIQIDPDTLEPRYRVIGVPGWGPSGRENEGKVKGICGSAIIDGVAEMFRTGIITQRGDFAEGLSTDRVREGDLGLEYVVARAEETSIGRDIPITLADVRQIQLAKAALYAAAHLLLRELGISRPDRIVLAGAFGSQIDPTSAMLLGMIPDCPLERVHSVGNAAGDGARIALLDRSKRAEALEVATSMRRLELPVDPDFQNEYLRAMNFPHMAHRFASIAHLIGEQGTDPLAGRFGTTH